MSGEVSPARPSFSLRFSARDLMRVAIFVVIFILIEFVIGTFAVLGPLAYLIAMPVSAIVNGITFLLFVGRVRHAGMVELFAMVLALFFLVDGISAPGIALICVLGVLAELILWAGGYRSRRAAILAYTVFSLCYFSPFLPILLDPRGYLATSSWSQMGHGYVTSAEDLFTVPVLGILALGTLVAGFLGGLLGATMLRKHFARAGLA